MRALIIAFKLLFFLNPLFFEESVLIKNFSVNAFQQSPKAIRITNYEIVHRVLEELNYNKISKNYKLVSRTFARNMYEPKSKDEIVNFSANRVKFSFFKGKYNVFLLTMELNSNNIVLDKDIYIGCNKSVFKTKYNIPLNSDTIIIEDYKGGNAFTFLFKNNRLILASYAGAYP